MRPNDQNAESISNSTRCITLVTTPDESRFARLMIKSLRKFGGDLANCRVTVYIPHAMHDCRIASDLENVDVTTIANSAADEALPAAADYPFQQKVSACAEAERTCGAGTRTLIWFNPDCFIVKPPHQLLISDPIKAAFRPVHIRNVGSLANEPADGYWSGIMNQVKLDDPDFEVETFVDAQRLRPYFNTHLFAIDPSAGILKSWLNVFQELAVDEAFQQASCQDPLHQTFLHQAILSALLAKMLNQNQIRILLPEYSYPLHLHERVPSARRIKSLDELVVAVYEDEDTNPLKISGLAITPELRLWIEEETLPR